MSIRVIDSLRGYENKAASLVTLAKAYKSYQELCYT